MASEHVGMIALLDPVFEGFLLEPTGKISSVFPYKAMKTSALLILLTCLALSWPAQTILAQEKVDLAKELRELNGRIQAKAKEDKKTEAALADELQQLDALFAQHKDEKNENTARILYLKGLAYKQHIKDTTKANAIFEQLQREYPDTLLAQMVKYQRDGEKIRATLVKGAKFPVFDKTDLEGKPLSLANFQGKVVLIDFWATWCGPCMLEMPNVQKAYQKYGSKGFEVIGVSLDRQKDKLTKTIAEKQMTWHHLHDAKSELASKYGITSIPATFLLDGEGKIIATNLRGEALEQAVGKALAAK